MASERPPLVDLAALAMLAITNMSEGEREQFFKALRSCFCVACGTPTPTIDGWCHGCHCENDE